MLVTSIPCANCGCYNAYYDEDSDLVCALCARVLVYAVEREHSTRTSLGILRAPIKPRSRSYLLPS